MACGAAMALKLLRGLSPFVARKLFNPTVTPVADYASSVWMHAEVAGGNGARTSADDWRQAVIGCFRTVATAVAEAEANLHTIIKNRICEKHWGCGSTCTAFVARILSHNSPRVRRTGDSYGRCKRSPSVPRVRVRSWKQSGPISPLRGMRDSV